MVFKRFSPRTLGVICRYPQRFLHATTAPKGMFCFQCEQTRDAKGCTTVGVCGKTPEVANLQDVIVHLLKGLSVHAAKARAIGGAHYVDKQLNDFILSALFATLTNVNFDEARMKDYIREADKLAPKAKQLYESACAAKQVKPQPLNNGFPVGLMKMSSEALDLFGESVGVLKRKATVGDDVAGLMEMCIYGLKGTAAYYHHATMLGAHEPQLMAEIVDALGVLGGPQLKAEDYLALAMKIGGTNIGVMEALDRAGTKQYGQPSPTTVRTTPLEGKAILVSGHDLVDLDALLKQTEGKGINVYTHGELLPAHGYPKLRAYKHLVGHYGGPWQLQKMEFGAFPGPIVMTTNCIMPPLAKYQKRLFTRDMVGVAGCPHLPSLDFSAVIKMAQSMDGFTEDDIVETKPLQTGFGHGAVLAVADKVLGAVKAGDIKRFFVIGGCDGSEGERSYFTELAKQTPKDSVILTMGCAKFRLNRLPGMGDIGGIPRVLDLGQCNDSYSGVKIAMELAKALKTDVNSLPLSFAVSWLEQKAVAVLLSLLHLNIQNIRLGPNLPAFCTPNMLKILQSNFKLKPIQATNVQADLKAMLLGQ